jgi:hypothetical protein
MRRKNEPIDVWLHVAIPKDGDIEPCWPWTGQVNKSDGRPYFTVGGVRWLAYRLTWTLVHGPIPDGQVLRHVKCANEVCCNPWHTTPGTQSQNETDKGDQDRWGFPKEVLETVLEYNAAGMPQAAIAAVCCAQFGILITQQRVSDIITGARRSTQTGVTPSGRQ